MPGGRMRREETGGIFLRFTIRDMFAVLTIGCLSLGWWLDHRRQVGEGRFQQWNCDILKHEVEVRTKGKVTVDSKGINIDMPSGVTVSYDRELNSN